MDEMARLAFSIAGNPGIHALLLGSGISRSASIPTGWDITMDLVRRIAAAEDVVDETDWAAWHRRTYGSEPGYSELLNRMTGTPAERRAILQEYIEPSGDDVEEGRRVPTKAHHAIARLVRDGFVRVVVTTNFDRLLENALAAAGVEPVVVRSEDDLAGAGPMQHARCFVLKLHGDYLDNRILNTDEELSSYPAAYDTLLDRIFDEYGLVVAGWSGDWDPALRAAIVRAPNRRYPTFWAARGAPSRAAGDIISARRADVVAIEDADGFFVRLADTVEVIAKSRLPSPSTLEAVLAATKRNLAKPERRIDLADGFAEQLDRLLTRVSEEGGAPSSPLHDDAHLLERWASIENLAEPLARSIGLAGRWGDGSEFTQMQDVVQAILDARDGGSGTRQATLSVYPAYLGVLTYALGLAKAGRWSELYEWFLTKVARPSRQTMRIVDCLVLQRFDESKPDWWKIWPGLGNAETAWADHLVERVVPWSRDYGAGQAVALGNYHRFEILAGMAGLSAYPDDLISQGDGPIQTPFGQTVLLREDNERLLDRLGLNTLKPTLLEAGFCEGREMRWDLALANFEAISDHVRW